MRAAILLLLFAVPASAQMRGNVLVETETHPGWISTRMQVGSSAIGYLGFPLIYKIVPFSDYDGSFYMPRIEETVFHYKQTVSTWDGRMTIFTSPEKGYTEIFHNDAELTEIAPIRSGNYLVAERRPGFLIEFNRNGVVAKVPFPGAMHIELLHDQCTVLFTSGRDDARVRRMNLCTGEQLSDFATLLPGQYAGSIRELPNLDVLVANEAAVLQFDRFGSLIRTWSYPPLTHLCLTPDGTGFWATGTLEGQPQLLRFDLRAPETQPASVRFDMGNTWALSIREMVVVGEWRSALRPVRARAVR